MMLGIKVSGSFDKTNRFLKYVNKDFLSRDLHKIGQAGVIALQNATPSETGETRHAWNYRILKVGSRWHIEWFNTHEHNGANVAILLQYGHATGTGGYVQGIDYINPALRPIFERNADYIWKGVTRA